MPYKIPSIQKIIDEFNKVAELDFEENQAYENGDKNRPDLSKLPSPLREQYILIDDVIESAKASQKNQKEMQFIVIGAFIAMINMKSPIIKASKLYDKYKEFLGITEENRLNFNEAVAALNEFRKFCAEKAKEETKKDLYMIGTQSSYVLPPDDVLTTNIQNLLKKHEDAHAVSKKIPGAARSEQVGLLRATVNFLDAIKPLDAKAKDVEKARDETLLSLGESIEKIRQAKKELQTSNMENHIERMITELQFKPFLPLDKWQKLEMTAKDGRKVPMTKTYFLRLARARLDEALHRTYNRLTDLSNSIRSANAAYPLDKTQKEMLKVDLLNSVRAAIAYEYSGVFSYWSSPESSELYAGIMEAVSGSLENLCDAQAAATVAEQVKNRKFESVPVELNYVVWNEMKAAKMAAKMKKIMGEPLSKLQLHQQHVKASQELKAKTGDIHVSLEPAADALYLKERSARLAKHANDVQVELDAFIHAQPLSAEQVKEQLDKSKQLAEINSELVKIAVELKKLNALSPLQKITSAAFKKTVKTDEHVVDVKKLYLAEKNEKNNTAYQAELKLSEAGVEHNSILMRIGRVLREHKNIALENADLKKNAIKHTDDKTPVKSGIVSSEHPYYAEVNEACELVTMKSRPNLSSLKDLAIKNAAFIRAGHDLFYVNKANNICHMIMEKSSKDDKAEMIAQFDSELRPTHAVKPLNDAAIKKIKLITGYGIAKSDLSNARRFQDNTTLGIINDSRNERRLVSDYVSTKDESDETKTALVEKKPLNKQIRDDERPSAVFGLFQKSVRPSIERGVYLKKVNPKIKHPAQADEALTPAPRKS